MGYRCRLSTIIVSSLFRYLTSALNLFNLSPIAHQQISLHQIDQFIYISPEPDASEDVEAIVNEQSDLVKMTYYAIKRKRKQKEIYAKQIESSEDGEDVVDSKQEYNLVASMRVDRYYSSIQENEAQFSKDALELLENEDYVEFFKSCGIGFVRR